MAVVARMLAILGLIGLVMVAAMAARGPEGSVAMTWGDMVLETSVPVALGLLAGALVLAYYLGQLMYWLGGLPRSLRLRQGEKKYRTALGGVDRALVAARLGLPVTSGRALDEALAQPVQHPLLDTAMLLLEHAKAAQSENEQDDDFHAALTCLMAARRHARAKDWAATRAMSEQGLGRMPDSPRLLTLRMKALMNLNMPEAASDVVPQLAGHTSQDTLVRLDAFVDASKGMASAERAAKVLQDPWTAQLNAWLESDSDTVPEGLASCAPAVVR